MTDKPIITLRGVEKRFGSFVAVRDLNLSLKEGEFFFVARAIGLRQDNGIADDRGISRPKRR